MASRPASTAVATGGTAAGGEVGAYHSCAEALEHHDSQVTDILVFRVILIQITEHKFPPPHHKQVMVPGRIHVLQQLLSYI